MSVKEFFLKVQFSIRLQMMMLTLRKTDSIYSYPMMVYLNFNKSRVYDKYKKGQSIKNQVISRANTMKVSLLRHINRDPSDALLERYMSMMESAETRFEIEEFMMEHNIILNEKN